MSKKGFPRRKEDLQLSVKKFLEKAIERLCLRIIIQEVVGSSCSLDEIPVLAKEHLKLLPKVVRK